MHKPVPVVIPYFRAPDALSLTLKVLDRQPNVRAIPFVRDNSEDNILFTKAVNEGLHKFFLSDDYEYILVLNQDALLHESCLEQLILVMSQSPTVGIAALVAFSKNKSVNWVGSAAAFPWGQHVTYDLTALPKSYFSTYWVNGACMLLRVSMIRELGLLDDGMRFICSDADYSFRARAAGWDCVVVPSAYVEHEPSGSSNVENLFLTQIKLEDQLYFSRKWVGSDIFKMLAFEGKN